MAKKERISLSEAARRSGVSKKTLSRWADEKIVPVRKGKWTAQAAAQAKVVARMRDRGYSLSDLKQAGKEGRLAFGLSEDIFADRSVSMPIADVAAETGFDEATIERTMMVLGTPVGHERELTRADIEALNLMTSVVEAGLPVEAVLQLVRVYAQAVRRIADAEVRLFHLFLHEPMIKEGLGQVEMAEALGEIVKSTSPVAVPLFEYLHRRYVRYFMEQDVVGHMEDEFGSAEEVGQVRITICFIDLTGFTKFTEEEGDAQAYSVIEAFTDTVGASLPPEANIVKTIGDEVMIISPDPKSLTEWAVGFLSLFDERPKPRAGIHYGNAVFRDGDYFGGQVNLAHRVVNRALGGEVLVTDAVAESIEDHPDLELYGIGEVALKGFPEPTALFLVSGRD